MTERPIAKRPLLTVTWFHAVPLVVSAEFALMEQLATGLLADYCYVSSVVFALLALGLARDRAISGDRQ